MFVPQTPETFAYDADGNLTQDGRWTYSWDAENRLIGMTQPQHCLLPLPKFKLDFTCDWMSRRTQKLVYTNDGAIYGYLYTNRFTYDGWNLIAILNPLSSILNSYQWGLDLSGSPQGAGGVGGLLTTTSPTSAQFAYFDGNGNVTSPHQCGRFDHIKPNTSTVPSVKSSAPPT